MNTWNQNHTELNYILADLYYDKDESRSVAKKASLNVLVIPFANQPLTNWSNIIEGALNQGKVDVLLETILQPKEKGGSADPAIHQTLMGIRKNLQENKVPIPTEAVDMEKPEETPGDFEKIMGSKSTLLPISFLEAGMQCAKAVVRIDVGDGLGTGFLIDGNWIITNNHVLPDEAAAASAVFQFNYQQNLKGLDMPYEEFRLARGDGNFFTNKKDDWSVAKLSDDANAKFGALTLSAMQVEKDDFVNIIQHPSGGPKQIALYHNTVTSVEDQYVFYLTDTMNGSSGSPVFNTDWEVVALHHWGGKTKEKAYPNLKVYRNRGINILRVKKALAELNIKS